MTAGPAADSAPPQVRRHLILGTAGHIDHGKTSLVRALTGTDTDRLPEERRRGMTIELGFAELTVGETCFGIVDVPGHERFIRTMVAGATGIDVALLVVAADDSVMPQTVEHVEILNLLGVQRGVVAVTKIDVADDELVDLCVQEVVDLLAGSPLAAAPVCRVSSLTGQGLEELRQALLRVADQADPRPPQRPFRMAIDRVFTVQGRGTVVTGSALRGVVEAGETLELMPAGTTCRVRDLQSHGAHAAVLERGQRTALNLSGVDREQLDRGMELATPGYLAPTHMIDVTLRCLDSCPKALRSATVVRLELGTVEASARVVLFGRTTLLPGESGYAQLRSGDAFTATYGQRFILRDENSSRTLGGGVVLRPVARRKRRDPQAEVESLRRLDDGEPADRLEEALRVAGFDRPSDLRLCAATGIELDDLPAELERLTSAGRWVLIEGTQTHVVPAVLDEYFARVTAWLSRHHERNPQQPGRQIDSVLGFLERTAGRGLARPLLNRMTAAGHVRVVGGFVCLPAFAPRLSPADERIMEAIIEQIRRGEFQPPAPEAVPAATGVDRKRLEGLLTLAVATGRLVLIEGRIFLHATVEADLRRRVAELIGDHGPATVAEIRVALGSSRKFVVPFLEYLDRVEFTRRMGDRRALADPARHPEVP